MKTVPFAKVSSGDRMADCLYIIVPAYNEEENIGKFVEEWYPLIWKLNQKEAQQHDRKASRLVIINDGSSDSTYEILQRLTETHPYLVSLTKSNEGHGPTLLYGYRYALSHGADYVFQTDSDGQTNPCEFGRFWKLRRRYDALFGNRMRRGDGFSRLIVEKVLCVILWLFFRIRVPDANAPFRLMKRSYLEEYLPKMPSDYKLPNVMLVAFGVHDHRRVRFLPISFTARQYGKNSLNIKKIIKAGWEAIGDFRKFRSDMK